MKRDILKQKVYHDGTSMIVLKPGDRHQVPRKLLPIWIEEGVVAEHEDDEDDELVENFTMKHVGGGRYKIDGPGLDEPELVKGKEEAEVRKLELEEAHRASTDEGGAPV